MPRSSRKLRAARVVHAPWARGDVGQMDAAGAVLDDDQGVDAPQEHGVHVDEIGREDAASLSGQKLRRRVQLDGMDALVSCSQLIPWA